MNSEDVTPIRRSYKGLGQILAFRTLAKVGWPALDSRYYPSVYGDCAHQCTLWAVDYFKKGNFSVATAQIEPTKSIARLARYDSIWYGKFAENAENRLRKVTLAHVVWRHILDDSDENCWDAVLASPDKNTKDNPRISDDVKRFFGLSRTEVKYVAGQRIEFDKTNEAKIINAVLAGQKRVQSEERAKLAFWKGIGYQRTFVYSGSENDYDEHLRRLDPLVDSSVFRPNGISLEVLLNRHALKFWDWLSRGNDTRRGLAHLTTEEVERVAQLAVTECRCKAIGSLAAAFPLRPVWQEDLDFYVNAGNVELVLALSRAGARVTKAVKRTAQDRGNPIILAILGVPDIWLENDQSSKNENAED